MKWGNVKKGGGGLHFTKENVNEKITGIYRETDLLKNSLLNDLCGL